MNAPSPRSPAKSWLPMHRAKPGAKARLFCLPYAGGSASVFRDWTLRAPPSIEVCAVEYPGRLSRRHEPSHLSVHTLAEAIIDGIGAWMEPPFALFGYSYGALIAFEVARELRRRGKPLPDLVVPAARRGPDVPIPLPDIHPLPDDAFLEAVHARYGMLPQAVRDDPELLALFLPMIRADLTAVERYRCPPEPALECSILAMGGERDPGLEPGCLEAWGRHTQRWKGARTFEGAHFFLAESGAAALRVIEDALALSAASESRTSSEAEPNHRLAD